MHTLAQEPARVHAAADLHCSCQAVVRKSKQLAVFRPEPVAPVDMCNCLAAVLHSLVRARYTKACVLLPQKCVADQPQQEHPLCAHHLQQDRIFFVAERRSSWRNHDWASLWSHARSQMHHGMPVWWSLGPFLQLSVLPLSSHRGVDSGWNVW